MTILLFVTAIVLSAIAAFYAVAGLIAIFAASAVPIAIMGGTLEVAKLVVASWLYRKWKEIPLLMKAYFTTALIVLMLLTSMGIFGYLSKAHLDQAVPTGDAVAKVSIVDEKIKIERENIANAQSLIKQMDAVVTGIIATGDREITLRDGTTRMQSAAERSLQVRRSQAKDRAALIEQIEQSQNKIVSLQAESAPLRSEVRKIEAEVGPIKYIAALIYGDNPGQDLLEKAVRWVIIMIVFVFDPLAVLMLIAFNKEIKDKAPITKRNETEKEEEILDKKEPTSEDYSYINKQSHMHNPSMWKNTSTEDLFIPQTEQEPVEEYVDDKPSKDWEQKFYKKVERPVPGETQELLKEIQEIIEEPLEKTELVQDSPFSAAEEQFELNATAEKAKKPTSGRPQKFKK